MSLDIDYSPCQGPVDIRGAYQSQQTISPLSHWIQSFWQLSIPAGSFSYRSLPDNCVDWIIDLNDPQVSFIITPFTSAMVFDMVGAAAYFGIRFRILGQQSIIATPVGEFTTLDHELAAADLVPTWMLDQVAECLSRQMTFKTRCHALSQVLLGALKYVSVDQRLARYIRFSYQNKASHIQLSDRQCAEFGLSARQLRRLTHLYLGLSPKVFSRVLRFQHTLGLMKSTSSTAVWASAYFDQAHFCREFKQIAGVTPGEFSNLSVLYNT